jgi:hypothetical protein
MATVNKDFKVKAGLVVEGTTGTINGEDILTKAQADIDYIIGEVGGSGESTNTPDTLVLRDGSGNFAAGTITADLTGDVTGTVSDISNHDTDDLSEGTSNKYFTAGRVKDVLTGSTQTNISITEIAGELHITAENGVDDSTTDDLSEGTTNKYFTDQRAQDALSGMYDTAGSASGVQSNLDDHAADTSTHGVTGDIVGTSDSQDLSNKKFKGATYFQSAGGAGGTNNYVDVNNSTGKLTVHSGYALDVSASNNVNITSGGGDIILNPDGDAYLGSASATNAIATQGDIDNLQSNIDNAGTSSNTVDTIVRRDGSGNFAAGTVDAQTSVTTPLVTIPEVGALKDNSGDLQLVSDNANSIQIDSAADIQVTAGTNIVLNPTGTAYYGGETAADEIATHGYVDNAVAGLAWKQSVNLLYDDATPVLSGSGATQLTVDGHATLGDADSGYRLLLTGGADAGIYVYNSASGSWTLTRADDADAFGELIGAAVYVMEGEQYGSTSWVQGNHYLTNFTGQSWTQFSGQGSVTAGNGITVNGLEVSIDTSVVATQTDLSTGLGTKQDTLTAGSNIDITSNTISVTGLASTDISDFSTAALAATASAYDASGAAATAEDNANTYTDLQLGNYTTTASLETAVSGYGFAYSSEIPTSTTDLTEGTNEYFTDIRAKSSAADLLTSATLTNITITGSATSGLIITAENGVDDSTTDDLSEGTFNHYYTDTRAKTATADLLTSATLSNITITGDETGLTITAENGVAGSDTDDLTEGSTNLYFTDARAVDAITNATIYPTIVDINDYRREEATQQYVASASTVVAHSFTGNRSVKYLARVVGTVSGTLHSQVTEILVTVDGNNNVAVTEFGSIHTTEPALATFTADYNSGSFRLLATTAVAGCEVVVAATLLSWAD